MVKHKLVQSRLSRKAEKKDQDSHHYPKIGVVVLMRLCHIDGEFTNQNPRLYKRGFRTNAGWDGIQLRTNNLSA